MAQSFDPNAFTVEDLFRARMARRQGLAELPFEQKIKIVEKLQQVSTAAMNNEKLIFASFLKVCPDLGNEIVEWDVVEEWYSKRQLAHPHQPFDKRPDIIALTKSGNKIGIELKSWVSREQITEARKQERIHDNILKAIGEQPPNETKHVGYIWLSAKQVRFDATDGPQFREELFALIEQVDKGWSLKPDWEQEQSDRLNDLSSFPILEKYLQGIQFYPAIRGRFDIHWIQFPSPGGAYCPHEMLETLNRSLAAHKTDARYRDLRELVGLDESCLLVHYDFKAFAYNTPFDAPDFGFTEAAEFASKGLAGDGGHFDRIFLFHFLWGQEEAYTIFPLVGEKRTTDAIHESPETNRNRNVPNVG